jgi:Zn-dependent protease with chaperone function
MAELNGGQRPPEFASTHPDPANRMQRLGELMPRAMGYYGKYCGAKPLPAR